MSASTAALIVVEGLYAAILVVFSLSIDNFEDASEIGVVLLQVFSLFWGLYKAFTYCAPKIRSYASTTMLVMEMIGLLSVVVYVSDTSNLTPSGMSWRPPIVLGAILLMVWEFISLVYRVRAQQMDVILESPKKLITPVAMEV